MSYQIPLLVTSPLNHASDALEVISAVHFEFIVDAGGLSSLTARAARHNLLRSTISHKNGGRK